MLTVIVPLWNEQESLAELVGQMLAVRDGMSAGEWEILLVDDGSSDGSWQVIQELSRRHSAVRGIRFRRNFGKAAALAAGFASAQGERVVTIDADLQDDPREIPKLLQKLDEGADLVSGWKRDRHDPWHKRWPSKVFNALLRRVSGLPLHDFNCGLKAYRHEVLAELDVYGEMHRFLPVLAAARGFRVTEIPVVHHPRVHGSSKYGWSRIPKGFMDLITVWFLTRYRYRPHHVLGGAGALVGAVGLSLIFLLAAAWGWSRLGTQSNVVHLHEIVLWCIACFMILVGVQLFGMGMLAEMIVANRSGRQLPYSIAERTHCVSSTPTHGT
ncbi:MAG: glycosyltransferase family 2 protein [Pirellula sp.]